MHIKNGANMPYSISWVRIFQFDIIIGKVNFFYFLFSSFFINQDAIDCEKSQILVDSLIS